MLRAGTIAIVFAACGDKGSSGTKSEPDPKAGSSTEAKVTGPGSSATSGSNAAGSNAGSSAVPSPIRLTLPDCVGLLTKVLPKHAPGGKISNVEGACRIDDRSGAPFGVFHLRCWPAGTEISAGAASKVIPREPPFRINETMRPVESLPCFLISLGVEMPFTKFQPMTEAIRKAFVPFVEKQYVK